MTPSVLLSIRFSRRSVGVAVFIGLQLEYTQSRQFSSGVDRAEASLTGLLNWLLASFNVESAAIEGATESTRPRQARLLRAAVAVIRNASIPIWDISEQDLLTGFGQPPLKNRHQLRMLMCRIWPALNARGTAHWILDAVAIGLHTQLECLFLHH